MVRWVEASCWATAWCTVPRGMYSTSPTCQAAHANYIQHDWLLIQLTPKGGVASFSSFFFSFLFFSFLFFSFLFFSFHFISFHFFSFLFFSFLFFSFLFFSFLFFSFLSFSSRLFSFLLFSSLLFVQAFIEDLSVPSSRSSMY